MEDNNETSETIVINNNLTSSIEEGEILNKRKVVGLYDPEENGFDLEMWNNTEPNKIFELSKKIKKMNLSEDEKNIYKTGDRVSIIESKPISKLKTWLALENNLEKN